MKRLDYDFFHRDCLAVAPDLVGKILAHRTESGEVLRLRISETEAYRGVEDTACHAHKGRTPRNEVLYAQAGTVYVYLCYGVHWLLNVITGEVEQPQGVLIRACVDAPGPGRLTKRLEINGSLNRTSFVSPDSALWIEDDDFRCGISRGKRVGIGYASQEDQDRLWRFVLKTP
ncbi:MAG: DNA-3-methyladenine glycosylase [Oscillospiraceae bacterium]|nr:DNA-3-methyladenine glycosylase [Oscillospiraceae bacterium]